MGNVKEKFRGRTGYDNNKSFKDRQPIPFRACAVVIYLLELDNIWLLLLFNIISVRYVTIYISYYRRPILILRHYPEIPYRKPSLLKCPLSVFWRNCACDLWVKHTTWFPLRLHTDVASPRRNHNVAIISAQICGMEVNSGRELPCYLLATTMLPNIPNAFSVAQWRVAKVFTPIV